VNLSQIFDYGNSALEKRAIFYRLLGPLLDFGRERPSTRWRSLRAGDPPRQVAESAKGPARSRSRFGNARRCTIVFLARFRSAAGCRPACI
jgi:hypothetical protein